jgi:hypothetical protein
MKGSFVTLFLFLTFPVWIPFFIINFSWKMADYFAIMLLSSGKIEEIDDSKVGGQTNAQSSTNTEMKVIGFRK